MNDAPTREQAASDAGGGGLALTSPIESAPGVGPTRGAAFRRLGIPSIAHLVDHIPRRYERDEAEGGIDELQPGQNGSARGEITACRPVLRGRKRFEAVLVDETGRLDLVWFNQTYLARRIAPGMRLRVQGKVQRRGPMTQMVNPQWEILPAGGDEPAHRDERLRPIYAASEELSSGVIDGVVQRVLGDALPLIEDHFDAAYREERALPELREAYRMLHAPRDEDEPKQGRRRLAYDELLMLQVGVQMKRAQHRAQHRAPTLALTDEIDARIRKRLPFELTPGQDQVVREIAGDVAQPVPMIRLVQGDVGAGKTAVAAHAMLLAVAHGHQAAMLAPTELLAEQHFAALSRMLADSGVRLALVTGSLPTADREAARARLASGAIDIAIGTHALLTEGVRFASLAVAVIDEQHRFGVHQRAALRTKGDDPSVVPHTLVMTATPIPRTLSLTIFGDLDVSLLKGKPIDRGEVHTRWVGPDRASEVWSLVRERVERGEQAYVVLPTIDGGSPSSKGEDRNADSAASESAAGSGLRGVLATVDRLRAGPLEGLRIEPMHGRMNAADREAVMSRFRAGEVDVLVATTVIEVGVDVANATVMVIDHAERFGLSQLHQLRGRVGRGRLGGVCVLMGEPTTEEARSRLETMCATSDGFELAERDLELRGPGEVFGSRQSGQLPFRAAELPRDVELLLLARRDAVGIVGADPELSSPERRLLRARLRKRIAPSLGLADVA